MNKETENFYDQEIEFTYDGDEYVWTGDYSVDYLQEEESSFAPAYGESYVWIQHTTSLSYYDEDQDQVVEVKPTPSILMELELHIERTL